MKGSVIIFLFICSALLFGGCSLDDDQPNFHFTALEITAADLPESFELNRTYRINFTYVLPDGCTYFERPDVTTADTTVRNVVAIGVVRTDDEACTQAIIEGEGFFNFSVIYNEPYTFRFFQGEDSNGEPQFLEVIVPVE